MSSILDALKKLEEEKARQQSNSLGPGEMDLLRSPTQHGQVKANTKLFIGLGLGALLLVIISVSVSVALMRQGAPNTPNVVASVTPTPPATPTTNAVDTTNEEKALEEQAPKTPTEEPVVVASEAEPAPIAPAPTSAPAPAAPAEEAPVQLAQATPKPTPVVSEPVQPAPAPTPVVEAPKPAPTPLIAQERPVTVRKPEPPRYTAPEPKPRRSFGPVDMDALPMMNHADRDRMGLTELKINLLRPPGERRPIGLAILNLDKVYVGDKIPGSSARLVGVNIHGIAVESTTSGAQYFIEH